MGKNGGFCPDVLTAAAHFIAIGVASSSFDAALSPSLEFAGPDNYCPVLAGALGGALFGVQSIDSKKHLSHCRPGIEDRCIQVADRLLATLTNLRPTWQNDFMHCRN